MQMKVITKLCREISQYNVLTFTWIEYQNHIYALAILVVPRSLGSNILSVSRLVAFILNRLGKLKEQELETCLIEEP